MAESNDRKQGRFAGKTGSSRQGRYRTMARFVAKEKSLISADCGINLPINLEATRRKLLKMLDDQFRLQNGTNPRCQKLH
jgi:hypothetical protein